MKRFYKENTVIFWLGIISALLSASYAITYNMPDYFGIEGWYSLLNNISISYLAALVFYITQVYLPQYKQKQQANACIRLRIENVIMRMDEIFDQLGSKYIDNYRSETITDEILLNILQKINVNDRVSVLNPNRDQSTKVCDENYFTVKEWIISRIEFVENEIDNIFKYDSSYITPELMKGLEDILQSTMHQNLARSLLKLPNGISFSECNQDIFLTPYYHLMKDLEETKKAYDA